MEIPDGYAQVNLKFTGNGVPTGAECTFGLSIDDPEIEPETVADNIWTIMLAHNIFTFMVSTVELTGILVKYGPNVTGPSAEVAGEKVGTYSSSDEIPNCSYLIRKNTAFGGRAGRGRMYWPGVALQEVNSGGIIQGSFLTPLNASVLDLHSDLSTAEFTPVLLHGDGSPIVTPTPTLSWTVDSQIATQRRRLRR